MNIFKRYTERKEKRERIEYIRNTAMGLLEQTRSAGIFAGAGYEYKDSQINISLECTMPFTMMTNEEWTFSIVLSSGEIVFKEKWEGASFAGHLSRKNKIFIDGDWVNYLESLTS